MPELRLSFEPADIINEVMSFGSPTPIDVAVSGPNLADNRAYAEKAARRTCRRSGLCAICNSASRSSIRPSTCTVDRKKAGLSGVVPAEVATFAGGGHVFIAVCGAELLARPEDGHRLPGAGANSPGQDDEHPATWRPCR